MTHSNAANRAMRWAGRVAAYLCILSLAMPATFTVTLALSSGAWADPPPWAPAHGYREKRHKGKKWKRRRGRRGRHGRGYDDRDHEYERGSVVVAPAVVVGTGTVLLRDCNRELVGSLVGAATGGLIGSRIGKGSGKMVAVVTGTILGVLIGGNIGRSMDRVDQSCAGQALEQAQTGQTVAWENPDNNGHYTVTPQRTYKSGEDRYCREYQTTVTVGGKTESAYGTACRQPDGSWQVVKTP